MAFVRRLLRRRLRRPHRLARRLRRDINHILHLSREISSLKQGLLKLAKTAETKESLKKLRLLSANLISRAREEMDYHIKVFVDAEVLVYDMYYNVFKNLRETIERLERQGFDRPAITSFKSKFAELTATLEGTMKRIRQLVVRTELDTIGGVSVASTVHLGREIKRLSKDIYGLRSSVMDLFNDLAKKEAELDPIGVQSDINLMFHDIAMEIDAVLLVARNNRILVKRFKDIFRYLCSTIRSTSASNEIKDVLCRAAENIERYEDRVLRQARRAAYKEYRVVS